MASTDKCTCAKHEQLISALQLLYNYVYLVAQRQQMTMAMMLLLLLLLMPPSLFTLSLYTAGRASADRHSAGSNHFPFFDLSPTHTHRLWANEKMVMAIPAQSLSAG